MLLATPLNAGQYRGQGESIVPAYTRGSVSLTLQRMLTPIGFR
jgi:hypothetical protein